MQRRQGALVAGVTEGEDAAVPGHEPVALAGGGGRRGHDGGHQLLGGHTGDGPEIAGVAVGEDTAVGPHEPVALAGGGPHHGHDGRAQGELGGGRGSVEGGPAEGEDPPGGGGLVVAGRRGRGRRRRQGRGTRQRGRRRHDGHSRQQPPPCRPRRGTMSLAWHPSTVLRHRLLLSRRRGACRRQGPPPYPSDQIACISRFTGKQLSRGSLGLIHRGDELGVGPTKGLAHPPQR